MPFASDAVFAEIKTKINAATVSNIGAVFKFSLTNASGETKIWTVNARDGAGSVTNADGESDCTISMTDADYMDLVSGKLNGMEAFMSGKLQIDGDMMLAQKLQDLTPSGSTISMNFTAAGEAAYASDVAFSEISRRLNAETVADIGASFKFVLTNATGQTKTWVVDARSGSGSVKNEDGEGDCTIIMTDSDFCDLISGKLNGMEAFMSGKLQIEGDMMLAQKLEQLSGAKSTLRMNPTSAESDAYFASAFVFAEMSKRLNAQAVKRVGHTYQFKITNHAGKVKCWYLDAKNGSGSITEEEKEADCTLILEDGDYISMVSGKANGMELFMSGKLQIEGDMMASQSLEQLQPASSRL